MKICFILLIIILCISCENKICYPRVIVIDSCEYIEGSGFQTPLVHKANCKNKFHESK